MNRIRVLLVFLLLSCTILFLANWVVLEGLMTAFNGLFSTVWLSVFLAILILCFILSIIIGMRFYNWATRLYTQISMVWMGAFVYLFMASVAAVIETHFFGHFGQMLAQIGYALALIVAAYGVVHKRNIVIKEIVVGLPKLDPRWLKRKAVLITDIHLGQMQGSAFAQNLVNKINTLSPDILFIGGDLFDGSAVEGILQTLEPFRQFKAPLGSYFVSGNHENYGHHDDFLTTIKKNGIEVLNDQKKVIDGLQLVGVDYLTTTTKSSFKKVLDAMKIDRALPTILLKHEPKHVEIAEQAGIDLQLSGHTHKAQQWPFQYIAYAVYKQFTYDLQKLNELQVYTSSGVGTWGPPIRVGTNSEIVVITFK